MKILIIGSGAREHAIARALHRSPQQPLIYCIGSSVNAGIKQLTQDYLAGDITDCGQVAHQAHEWAIDLCIIGPEAPLEMGLADALWQIGIATIGPKKSLARIETSKEFARNLMQKYNIPGLPVYKTFNSISGVEPFLDSLNNNYVIKANGLMGGKGVKLFGEHLHSKEEALSFCEQILAKKQSIIIEEKLEGQEFSFMCFADGVRLFPMPLVQDHKRAFAGDEGPNTGGMGSYSDANHSLPFLSKNEVQTALAINNAVYHALTLECQDKYIGFLYGSFIATAEGVYVIEFNARMGDPEALNVLSILESDFVTLCAAMVTGRLDLTDIHFANKATVCKYAVPEGYPDKPLNNFEIDIHSVTNPDNLYLGAVNQINDRTVATGSRTAAYVGIANTIYQAEFLAEAEISRVGGSLYHRKDIGTAALIEQRITHMQRLKAQ
ncbi:phosphoribosylamine--glycine ligase [Legionella sp. 16cNR16C]|uniref:phosphoribosylamine--glycine ligase n=1 Tax=Legionella sp. 16cNR16C TaxID=2905656 RepID=UPI001E358494|nr:phosphoribosylamine--glycine ligase [Legionella sp. 16cNR16C]